MRRVLALVLAALVALTLGGCVTLPDPEASQELRGETVARLTPASPAALEFTARRSGMNSIQVWLRAPADQPVAADSPARLHLSLRALPGREELAAADFPLPTALAADPLVFAFTPQAEAAGMVYRLELSLTGEAAELRGSAEEVRAAHAVWSGDQLAVGDAAVRFSYDYGPEALTLDFGRWFQSAWLVIPLLATLWLPGRLLLKVSGIERDHDPGEVTALAVGLSLAAFPVLLTWTSLLGLHWSRTGWLLLTVLLGGGLAFAWGRERPSWRQALPHGPSLALLLIFLAALGVRLAMVRDLAAPPWVDSIHHGLLTRLIQEAGAFPSTYRPYLPLETSSYHGGFHAVLAVFTDLTQLPLEQAMLIFGQVLNALAVVAVYSLARSLTGDPWLGVLAALLTGLFSPMPAYYTSWGRYTQLAGLLILPPALALLQRALPGLRGAAYASERLDRRALALAALACGGLFLTHYRVIAFLALLLAAVWLGNLLLARPTRGDTARLLGGLLLAALGAILLTLPWWPQTVTTLFIPKLSWSAGPPAAWFNDWAWNYLDTAWGKVVLALAAVGWAAALWERRVFAPVLTLWVGLMFVLANLGALGLPGAGFVNNASVEIALFMPLSLLGAYPLVRLAAAWKAWLPPSGWAVFRVLAAVGLVALSLGAARALLPILNPVTLLYRGADRAAIEWAAANLPPDETVLINPFAWGYDLYAGNDGGYWLTPLGLRATLPPPVLYGLANDPATIAGINATLSAVLAAKDDAAALAQVMQANGVRFVLLGSKGGALNPHLLRGSPAFALRYAHEGAWVFEVNAAP